MIPVSAIGPLSTNVDVVSPYILRRNDMSIKRFRFICFLLASTVMFGISALPAWSTRYYVNQSAAGGDGASWETAFSSLGDAVAKAFYKDEIWVAKGTYQPPDAYGFSVYGGVSIYGGFIGTETSKDEADPTSNPTVLDGALSGGNSYNTVYIREFDPVIIDGFTIKNAWHGIYVSWNAKATITRCSIKNNTEPGDSGSGGAGILISGAKQVDIDQCIVGSNSSAIGGGINIGDSTTVTIKRSIITDNFATYTGGAVNVVNAQVLIENTVFYGNRTSEGPGPSVYTTNDSAVSVTNCTFYQNTGPHGNAVCSFSPAVATVTNCIIADNTSGSREHFYTDVPEQLTVQFSLIPASLNSIYTLHHGEYGTPPADGGGNVIGAVSFANPSSLYGADGLPFTADDGLMLSSNSPGIDIGTSATPQTDIIGYSRLAGNGVDAGAYEYGGSAPAVLNFTAAVSTYFDSYSVGRRHAARLVITGSHPTPVDVYVAIFMPDGNFLCCSGWRVFGPMNTAVPMLSGWTVEDTDENAMVIGLPALPLGTYKWVLAVVESGASIADQAKWLATSEALWSFVEE